MSSQLIELKLDCRSNLPTHDTILFRPINEWPDL